MKEEKLAGAPIRSSDIPAATFISRRNSNKAPGNDERLNFLVHRRNLLSNS